MRRPVGESKEALSAEEQVILQRARGTRAAWPAVETKRVVPYPAASNRTLRLIGSIDALLKAPPQPPRWALLRVLSMLEEAAVASSALADSDGDGHRRIEEHWHPKEQRPKEWNPREHKRATLSKPMHATTHTEIDAVVRRAFKRVDRNQSGTIDVRDIGKALALLGIQPDEREVHVLLKRFNMQLHAGLHLEDFASFVHAFRASLHTNAAVAEELRLGGPRSGNQPFRVDHLRLDTPPPRAVFR